MKTIKKIVTLKNGTFIFFVLVFTIIFETYQQLFYIERYNLFENVTFLDLLKNQSFKWVIWLLVGLSLILFVKKDFKRALNFKLATKYAIIIIVLVLVNILLISILQMLFSEANFDVLKLFSEYFRFYVFQKSPIYVLGYLAITIILFLSFTKKLLEVEVQELIELKRTNNVLYNQLKKASRDKAKVLNIKVGNKRKIIPVDSITWLEADDYCVIVHTKDNPSYAMRISLKSLEEKLGDNFLRVHRKAIVNMKMVDEFNLSKNPELILKDHQKVSISKSKIKFVKDFFGY